MKLLITGGAGFIGANFIFWQRANHPGDEIVCLDKMTYAANPDTLRSLAGADGFRFERGDVADGALVDALFRREKPDIVVNFAAETHVDNSIHAPDVFLRTNILGVQSLLNACRAHGVKRYHQISTDEVYGDLPLDRPELSFDEDSPIRTSSPYSASKAGADLLTLACARTFGVPVSITRCSNNYGPYQFKEKLIPLMISRAIADQPLPVYGRGENIRDWIHTDDHCAAIDRVMREGREGQVYNVGANCERRNIDIVRTLLRLLGKPESLISYVTDRPGHDLRYAVNAGKLRAELGWTPRVPFEEGLEATVRWYVDHRAWWDRA